MRAILSIDGGGIRGVFPCAFLAAVEDAVGPPVSRFFDLIVGTSTGGILALGLGLQIPARELLSFYVEDGTSVFRGNRLLRFVRHLGVSKFSPDGLREAITKRLGERLLGDSSTRLVIPSLNLETGDVHLFKTSHHARLETDYRTPAVEIAMATAAAPTYFPTHRSEAGTPLIDGGVWANNPVGVAAIEATAVLQWPASDTYILSLGCTKEPLQVTWPKKLPLGLAPWAAHITDVFLAAQSSAALATAHLVLGEQHVQRVDPSVPRGRFSIDDVREIEALRGLGESEARSSLPTLRNELLAEEAETFRPFHTH